MTTKFIDQCNWQFSKSIHRNRQSQKVRENYDTLLKRHKPIAHTLHQPIGGDHILHATLLNLLTKTMTNTNM